MKRVLIGVFLVEFLAILMSPVSAEAKSTKLNIKINPVLETSVSYTPITIESDGILHESDVNLHVSSNNRTGFKTTMSTVYNSSEENATSLVFEDIDSIPTISGNVAAESFTANTWGYSLNDGTSYRPIVAKDAAVDEIFATEKASDNGDKIIKIGIKVNNDKTSGSYTNTLLFTTVPNYSPITLDDIRYMQEVTPEVCDVTPTPTTTSGDDTTQYQLEDIRDGKIYFVAKLKDDNCWMTQNLDYDLNTTTTLTPEDSDVQESWTPARNTITNIEDINSESWTSDIPYSFDPGNYYYDGTYNSSACNYLTTNCDHSAPTPYASNSEHGHMGNYYSWTAAVASNDTSALGNYSSDDASSSVCPKGWRLPHGSQSAQGDEFKKLTMSYNIGTESDQRLLASPLFFTHGGYIYHQDLVNANYWGLYWTSTAVYDFKFNSEEILFVHDGRYIGFNVRCVARKETQTLTIKDATNNSILATYDFETTYKLQEAPEKEGYNLLGYTEDLTSTEPTYNVGDIISEPKTLYAIYEEAILYMQDVANWKDKLELEQQVQVVDKRDNKIYWVSKLKDGNIWMTQNLDLDLSTETTLTPEDSDVTASWTPSRATIVGAANLNKTNWADNNNSPYSFNPGNYYFDGTYYSSVDCNYLTNTCSHFATTPYDLNGEHGHVGNYYNWSAAVASNDTSATTAAGTDINTSICPKGWRLPHGYQSTQGNDFTTLNTAYGGATNSDSVLLANPLFFVRGGSIDSGPLRDVSYRGYYWSSTANSASFAGNFLFDSGYVNSSDNYYRNRGRSIRCLAR